MSEFQRSELIYEGKAKKLFAVEGRPELVWQEFKDDLTAFNAVKKGSFPGKGALNCEVSSVAFDRLEKKGLKTHRVRKISESEEVIRKLKMVPVEIVVRNWLTGSTAKRLGLKDGEVLKRPLLELYFKNDSLGDPFISDDQALMLGIVQEQQQLSKMKAIALRVNEELLGLFAEVGIQLVDFKIELGMDDKGEFVLADEISCDTCRFWDRETGERFDKDRFRLDLGSVEEGYREVVRRLRNLKPGRKQ